MLAIDAVHLGDMLNRQSRRLDLRLLKSHELRREPRAVFIGELQVITEYPASKFVQPPVLPNVQEHWPPTKRIVLYQCVIRITLCNDVGVVAVFPRTPLLFVESNVVCLVRTLETYHFKQFFQSLREKHRESLWCLQTANLTHPE